jgi:hypothetical protein
MNEMSNEDMKESENDKGSTTQNTTNNCDNNRPPSKPFSAFFDKTGYNSKLIAVGMVKRVMYDPFQHWFPVLKSCTLELTGCHSILYMTLETNLSL